MKYLHSPFAAALLLLTIVSPLFAAEPAESNGQDQTQIIQQFSDEKGKVSEIVAISDKNKQIVMFAMGVPLLILLFATGALGIAMGVYGKPVFLAHMICAGLSMTLALAHAIVGLVWFYPF